MSKLIIIEGSEATGKSNIAHYLSDELKIDYISKDAIKEKMFDECKVSTWRYVWYERRAKQDMFRQAANDIDHGKSLIIESNFKTIDKRRLKRLLGSQVQVYEIFCSAKGLNAFRRFVRRNESGLRHKGHHDRRWYGLILLYSISKMLKIHWPYTPMKLSDRLLYVDTSDFAKIDYAEITKFVSPDN